MKRIFTAAAAASLVVGVISGLAGGPAAADLAGNGYDSSYFGESAFLSLTPGQSGQFAVGFNNTGAVGWVSGGASQVDLQVCLADKVTCGTPSPNSAWASSWLSSTAYATTTTSFVGPGQTGWFVYNIVAPSNSAGMTVRFNGDLALHATGQQIHPQGYYQDASVSAAASPSPSPAPPGGGGGGGGGGTVVPAAVSSVTASNLREITVNFNQAMATTGTGSFADRWHYTLSGGLDIDGARSTGGSTVILTVGSSVAGARVHDGNHLSATPATYMSNNGSYTLTVTNVATAGFSLTGTSSTAFTVTDTTAPTANTPVLIGAFSFTVTFSKPMDPVATNNNARWDSQFLCGSTTATTATTPDCNALTQGGIANLHWQDRSNMDCANATMSANATADGCFTVLRVDFLRSQQPGTGINHSFDLTNSTDAAGNRLSGTTSFQVNLPTTTTNSPTVSSVTVALDGNQFYLDVTFSTTMAHSANGYSAPGGIDLASNYILRNPDGSAATTGGSNSAGSAISITVIPTADADLSRSTGALYKLQRARLVLSPVGANNGQGATTSPTLRANTSYTVEVDNVKDEAGNTIQPGTVRTLSWGGQNTGPGGLRAYVTTTQLMVDYSEQMSSFVGSVNSCTNACDRTHYSSPNSTLNTWLGTLTSPSPGTGNGVTPLSLDHIGVNFTNTSTLAAGTYELDITGVVDPFGNNLSPNPAILTVTVSSTTRPALVCAGLACTGVVTNSTQFALKYSEQMQGGTTGTNSAGNPANYSVDNGTFGSLCTVGSPTITAGAVAGDGTQVWTVSCGATGTGVWSGVASNTVTVSNVQDLSNNLISPNPSTAAFSNP